MIAVCNTTPETEKMGVGYTDFKSLDEQAKLVRQYTGKPTDPEAPPARQVRSQFQERCRRS